MENSTELLTVKQVCNILNISVASIYRWSDEGRLPFPKIKIGPGSRGAVRFRKSDVEEYINNQCEPKKEVA